MPFRPDEEEPKLTIKLTNTERVSNPTDGQAGPGALINEDAAVQFESDDYASEVKIKIGQYLDTKIREEAVASQARIRHKPPRTAVLQDHDINAPSNAGPNSYISDEPQETKTAFETTGNSGQFNFDISVKRSEVPSDENEDPEAEVLRTRAALYSEVNSQNSNSVLAQAAENIVDRNARFSPKDGTIFINPENQTEEGSGTRSHILYGDLGSYPSKDFAYSKNSNTNNQTEIKIEQLKDLGLRMLMQASGEVLIPENGSTKQVSAARAASTFVPGLGRLGIRQNSNRFSALELIKKVNPDLQKGSIDIDLDGTGNPSYGNVNNPLVPFSAISSASSSVVVSSLLIMTISAIMQGLAEMFSAGDDNLSSPLGGKTNPSLDENADTVRNRRRRLGSYRPMADSETSPGSRLASNALGLTGFKNLTLDTAPFRYKDCVARGLEVFFGIQTQGPATAILGNSVLGAAASSIEAPGYWNTILRTLLRDLNDPMLTITNGIANLAGVNVDNAFAAKTPYDIDRLITPNTDPSALKEVINVIKDSRFIKFMNIIAAIGKIDLAVNSEAGARNINISNIDSIIDTTTVGYDEAGSNKRTGERINPASLVKKNRLSNLVSNAGGTPGALAWGASTLPSLYLQTTNLTVAEQLFTGETQNMTTVSSLLKKDLVEPQSQPRISSELVEQIEDELDSYYVPFYFHDLRTNEIISFHAFLDNINDSFNVDYNESQAYGRMGSVYSYKNTNRSISLTFKVVSTNKSDFDQMWYKINKLLMLCFPQYTAGRSVSFDSTNPEGTFSFTQPFSQLPSSSPLIRMRVGDIFKTNYSEFDLARLHGLGEKFSTPSINNPESGLTLNSDAQSRVEQKARIIRSRLMNFDYEINDKFLINLNIDPPGSTPESNFTRNGLEIKYVAGATTAAQSALGRFVDRNVGTSSSGPRFGNIQITAGEAFTVTRKIGPKKYQVKRETQSGEEGVVTLEIDFSRVDPGDFTTIGLDETYVYSLARTQAGVGAGDVVNLSQQTLDDVRNEVDFMFANGLNGETATNTNPIFKAFASTKGEGLPGVIKSINFDWNQGLWETEHLNSRAPKMATIQLDFAPIFDINPGLDSNGNMIGAIYNVGEIMQRLKINKDKNRSLSKKMNFVARKKATKTNFED